MLPAALVVIDVGGPMVVDGVVVVEAGACPGPLGGAAFGVAVCDDGVPGAPGAPPGVVLCTIAQLVQPSNRNRVVIRNVIRILRFEMTTASMSMEMQSASVHGPGLPLV